MKIGLAIHRFFNPIFPLIIKPCPRISHGSSVRNGARPHARHGYYRSRACLIAFLPARRTSNYFYSSMRLVIDVCAFGNVCLWTYDVLCPKILWKDPSSLKWGLAGLASIFVLKYRHPFHFSPFLCPWVPVPQAVSLFSLYGYQSHRLSLPLNRRINCDIEEQVEKRQVSASQEEEPDLEDEIYSDYESELSGLSDVNSDFSDAELL